MSLIDDARRLRDGSYLVDDQGYCATCGGGKLLEDHQPDCPWLSLPGIVAALEEARSLILGLPETSLFIGHGPDRHCRFCGCTTYHNGEWRGPHHAPDCRWQACVARLQGRPS